jgi:hypothetical protein
MAELDQRFNQSYSGEHAHRTPFYECPRSHESSITAFRLCKSPKALHKLHRLKPRSRSSGRCPWLPESERYMWLPGRMHSMAIWLFHTLLSCPCLCSYQYCYPAVLQIITPTSLFWFLCVSLRCLYLHYSYCRYILSFTNWSLFQPQLA